MEISSRHVKVVVVAGNGQHLPRVKERAVDVISLNFSKGFNLFSHSIYFHIQVQTLWSWWGDSYMSKKLVGWSGIKAGD